MKKYDIKYGDLFYLFIFASWIGVILEGLYCLFKFHVWESHVVSVYGHFCIIYGFGIVGYYIISHYIKKLNIFYKFIIYAFVGTMVELICGLVLEYGLHMYAWRYTNSFLNFKGHICLSMFIVWGIFGIVFEKITPYIHKLVSITRNKFFNFILPFFTAFMIFNFTVTGVAIVRWAQRHDGNHSSNKLIQHIDRKYNDDYMSNRFMEWHFFENNKESGN